MQKRLRIERTFSKKGLFIGTSCQYLTKEISHESQVITLQLTTGNVGNQIKRIIYEGLFLEPDTLTHFKK